MSKDKKEKEKEAPSPNFTDPPPLVQCPECGNWIKEGYGCAHIN